MLQKLFVFFKQKTAYDVRISDWSSDVCSSDLLTRWPVTASTTIAQPATHGPVSPAIAKIDPPRIIPSRIEIDVPISTSPLPPVSSRGCSTAGRIEYFTGPNRVDCTPVRNSATRRTGREIGRGHD